MITSTRRTRRGLAVIAAAAGALALGLVPAVSASALTPPPVFSYLDAATRQALVANADGTPIAPALAPTALVPVGYRSYSYDVSQDGDTIVEALCGGTAAVCNDNPIGSHYDGTYGLVVTHRSGATVTSHLVSNVWNANPVLSADGATVTWLLEAPYDYNAPTAPRAVSVYQYDVASGVTTLLPVTTFAALADETVIRLAVSPDGLDAAAVYSDAGQSNGRVYAAPLATVPDVYFEKTYGTASVQPDTSTFVFTKDDTLLYAEADTTLAAPPLTVVSALVPSVAPHSAVTVVNPALKDFYDIRLASSGTWWMWKDRLVGAPATTVSAAYSTTDANLATNTSVAPTLLGDRSNGDTTLRYVPSAVAPPALTAPVDNRAAAHPALALAASVALYGRRVPYISYNLYLKDLPGYAYSLDNAVEVDRGTLQSSIDGLVFRDAVTTTGTQSFWVPSKSDYYFGNTPVLARNTWFRWVFKGNLFTAAGTSRVLKVAVVPIVSAKVLRSGTKRTVYGAATRKSGTAVLYRMVGTKLVKVAVATLTTRGAYTFGKRTLVRGTYKVVTIADKYWGAGSSARFAV